MKPVCMEISIHAMLKHLGKTSYELDWYLFVLWMVIVNIDWKIVLEMLALIKKHI